jgi:plasmid stabilization system protein ParE
MKDWHKLKPELFKKRPYYLPGCDRYFFRYERHFVYWRHLSNGDIGIVTILHERMHQIDRFKEDFFG